MVVGGGRHMGGSMVGPTSQPLAVWTFSMKADGMVGEIMKERGELKLKFLPESRKWTNQFVDDLYFRAGGQRPLTLLRHKENICIKRPQVGKWCTLVSYSYAFPFISSLSFNILFSNLSVKPFHVAFRGQTLIQTATVIFKSPSLYYSAMLTSNRGQCVLIFQQYRRWRLFSVHTLHISNLEGRQRKALLMWKERWGCWFVCVSVKGGDNKYSWWRCVFKTRCKYGALVSLTGQSQEKKKNRSWGKCTTEVIFCLKWHWK